MSGTDLPAKVARIAGAGYLVIILAGIAAEFALRGSLVVPGDAPATWRNIAAAEGLFRLSITGDLIMLVADIVVAAALYLLLAPVNRGLALVATFFRLVHAAVYGAGLLNLTFVLGLVSGAAPAASFSREQLHGLAALFLQGQAHAYVIGLVFFAFHCLVLAYLVYVSGFWPRILGVLLAVAALGYLVDSSANLLLRNYADHQQTFLMIVFVPAFVGELSFALWLLIRGVRVRPAA